MLADLADGFQEECLPARPLVLQKDDGVAQRHVVPAVREGSQLRTRGRGVGHRVTEAGGEGPGQGTRRPGSVLVGAGHAGGDGGSEGGVRREEAEHQRKDRGLLLRSWAGGGGRARGALGEKSEDTRGRGRGRRGGGRNVK